jgi:hypothetical protein
MILKLKGKSRLRGRRNVSWRVERGVWWEKSVGRQELKCHISPVFTAIYIRYCVARAQ